MRPYTPSQNVREASGGRRPQVPVARRLAEATKHGRARLEHVVGVALVAGVPHDPGEQLGERRRRGCTRVSPRRRARPGTSRRPHAGDDRARERRSDQSRSTRSSRPATVPRCPGPRRRARPSPPGASERPCGHARPLRTCLADEPSNACVDGRRHDHDHREPLVARPSRSAAGSTTTTSSVPACAPPTRRSLDGPPGARSPRGRRAPRRRRTRSTRGPPGRGSRRSRARRHRSERPRRRTRTCPVRPLHARARRNRGPPRRAPRACARPSTCPTRCHR